MVAKEELFLCDNTAFMEQNKFAHDDLTVNTKSKIIFYRKMPMISKFKKNIWTYMYDRN